jgi:hypothetical protein
MAVFTARTSVKPFAKIRTQQKIQEVNGASHQKSSSSNGTNPSYFRNTGARR